MNLASQSVLEGLNACLDHRGEVSLLMLCSDSLILDLHEEPEVLSNIIAVHSIKSIQLVKYLTPH
jgi:midasin (ATPase involved in ribosome maturation)